MWVYPSSYQSTLLIHLSVAQSFHPSIHQSTHLIIFVFLSLQANAGKVRQVMNWPPPRLQWSCSDHTPPSSRSHTDPEAVGGFERGGAAGRERRNGGGSEWRDGQPADPRHDGGRPQPTCGRWRWRGSAGPAPVCSGPVLMLILLASPRSAR